MINETVLKSFNKILKDKYKEYNLKQYRKDFLEYKELKKAKKKVKMPELPFTDTFFKYLKEEHSRIDYWIKHQGKGINPDVIDQYYDLVDSIINIKS